MPSAGERESTRVYVGLGSNLGDGRSLINQALGELDCQCGIRLLRRSSLYSSGAWGQEDQPDFINAVAELDTSLSAAELLVVLLATEKKGGRVRNSVRWGPRAIDLDLLLYGQDVLRLEGLEVPHPRMHLRAFVLLPLLELVPEMKIPGIGPARKCCDELQKQRVQKII
jgi:2-amino-4-hydroxy-6-hydroxymethyldihydropteridine diphosphokinase